MADDWNAWIRELCDLPREQWRGWLAHHFPKGIPRQWWWSFADSVESMVMVARHRDGDPGAALHKAVAVLGRARTEGGLTPWRHAYWLARLSATAARQGPAPDLLPQEVMPGAAAHAIFASIPVTPVELVELRKVSERYRNEEDDVDFTAEEHEALGEWIFTIDALDWLIPYIHDRDLLQHIQEWRTAAHSSRP
ncbi:hypothetical protein [Nonomuraea typhae]|uniref:DUF4240 domain-containing protein n=1 Tax=Nonomuraea typhae TaxID=2603600 RepID=A0ABW7YND6_9ACTN